MELRKETLDDHNRKKTAVKIPAIGGGGGVAAIGAVVLLGGALATAAFFRKRGWNSGKDRRRRLQDQKNCEQDGSFGAAEAASNGPNELSEAAQGIDNIAAVGESTQGDENLRVEIEAQTLLVDGCDHASVEQSLSSAIMGDDAISTSTNKDETLCFEAENMMNGGEVKISLIKEDHNSDEVEINKANNFVIVYDEDVIIRCEHGLKELQVSASMDQEVQTLMPQTEATQSEEKELGVLYIINGEKCHKIVDHGDNGGDGSEEANGDEKENATREDSQVELVVEDELVKKQGRFDQGGEVVGPKDELVATTEGNTSCEENFAIGIVVENPLVDDEKESLMKGGLCMPTSNESRLESSSENKENEEDMILLENIDKVEEEDFVQVMEVKQNNVVGRLEEYLMLLENVEDEVEEEKPTQVTVVKENNIVHLPKQHKDNVESDTPYEIEKVESTIADDVAMRMSGDTNHSSEIVEEKLVETNDSCLNTQRIPDVGVGESLVENCDSCSVTQHLPNVIIEEGSVKTGGSFNDDSDHSSEIVIEDSLVKTIDSLIDSKLETIPPPNQLHVSCQEHMGIREMEGKILEDAVGKTKTHGGDGKDSHSIPYSAWLSSLPKKRLMKKYMVDLSRLKTNPTRRTMTTTVGSVMLWFSWFFGMSFVMMCTIVALTIALSKFRGYCVEKWANLKEGCLALVAAATEKLLPEWNDIKKYLKHKHKNMNMEQLIVRLRIKEDELANDMRSPIHVVNANIMEHDQVFGVGQNLEQWKAKQPLQLRPMGRVGKPQLKGKSLNSG